MCWNAHCRLAAVCQFSRVTSVGARPGSPPRTMATTVLAPGPPPRCSARLHPDTPSAAAPGSATGVPANPALTESMKWLALIASYDVPLPLSTCNLPLVTKTPRSAPFHR